MTHKTLLGTNKLGYSSAKMKIDLKLIPCIYHARQFSVMFSNFGQSYVRFGEIFWGLFQNCYKIWPLYARPIYLPPKKWVWKRGLPEVTVVPIFEGKTPIMHVSWEPTGPLLPERPELSPLIVNTNGYIAFLFHFVVKGRTCSLIIFTHYLNALYDELHNTMHCVVFIQACAWS